MMPLKKFNERQFLEIILVLRRFLAQIMRLVNTLSSDNLLLNSLITTNYL